METPNRPKFKIGPHLILLILGGVLLYALATHFGLSSGRAVPDSMVTPSPVPSTQASPAKVSSTVAPVAAVKLATSTPLKHEDSWRKFREKFGVELQIDWGHEGYAATIRGAPGAGTRAQGEFAPEDPQKAIARAREVIEAAHDLLGLQGELPLEAPIAKGNAVSSQVYFREESGGVPIAPHGSVTVDLGSQGEVLNVFSDYIRDVHVVNTIQIDAEQAKSKAAAAVVDSSTAMKVIGGNPVIWVARTAADNKAEGHHAYETTVQGRQVIIDAATGAVLYRKDRREY